MTPHNRRLDGIFDGRALPTPDLVSLWLKVTRTTLGWSLAEAAHEAEVALEHLRRLEETGDSLNEADDDALDAVASTYQGALYDHEGDTARLAFDLSRFGGTLCGDSNFPLARFLRARRAELGLSLEEVIERAGGEITVEQLHAAEWDGTRTGFTDYDDDLRAAAKALEVPYLTLRLLAERGTITEADVDEWCAHRAAQQRPRSRARRAA